MLHKINKNFNSITLNIISTKKINKSKNLVRRIKDSLEVKLFGIKKSNVKKIKNSFSYDIFNNYSIIPYSPTVRCITSRCNKQKIVTISYSYYPRNMKTKSNYNKVLIRSMHKSSGTLHYMGTIVAPKIKCNFCIKRYLPDHGYTAIRVNAIKTGKHETTGHNIYDTKASTATGQDIPQHEQSHVVVRDNKTGLDVALLTSAKNPLKGNEFLAAENVKGDILPDGKPKPQYRRALKDPRYSQESSAYEEDVKATAF